MSQVVIVRKKSGEICLCIDFWALNTVTIHNSFPLPRIEEALQEVKSAMWFISFDLAQGYLQLAMDEADIHKTAFHAGSSGLYEFTRMPFGLSNMGASFVTSWRCVLEINSISRSCSISMTSVFSAALLMRCWTGSRWYWNVFRTFNLKIKPKESFSFNPKYSFLGHILSKEGISPNPKKVQKVKDWPVPSNAKEVHSFLGLASYYRQFIWQFAKWANPLHDLIRPIAMKKTRARIRLPPLEQNLPPFE